MKEFKLRNFITVFCILIIIQCNSIYVNIYPFIDYTTQFGITFLLLSFIFYKSSNSIDNKKIIKSVGLGIICFIYMTIFFIIDNLRGVTSVSYVYSYMLLLPLLVISFSLSNTKEIKLFINQYINVVLLISIVSLLGYTVTSLLDIVSPSSYVFLNWGKNNIIPSYYNIHFQAQGFRNTSFFVEGPMFAVILILSLVFLMMDNKLYTKKAVIIVITGITTESTTLIISVIIMYLAFFIFRKEITIKFAIVIFSFLPVILTISFITIYKVLNQKAGTLSYGVRWQDLDGGYRAWKASPIFGWGFNNLVPISYFFENYSGVRGGSNALTTTLSQMGIYIFIIYLLPFFSLMKSPNFKSVKYITGIIIYAVIIGTTVIQTKAILFIFILILIYINLEDFDDFSYSSNI